jgi:hypothetical protein
MTLNRMCELSIESKSYLTAVPYQHPILTYVVYMMEILVLTVDLSSPNFEVFSAESL